MNHFGQVCKLLIGPSKSVLREEKYLFRYYITCSICTENTEVQYLNIVPSKFTKYLPMGFGIIVFLHSKTSSNDLKVFSK